MNIMSSGALKEGCPGKLTNTLPNADMETLFRGSRNIL